MDSYTSNFCPISFTCTMCGEPHSKYLPPGTNMTSCSKCGNLIPINRGSRNSQALPRGFHLPEMTPYRIDNYDDSEDYDAYLNAEEAFNEFLNIPITTNRNQRDEPNTNGLFSIHVPNDRYNNRRANRRQSNQESIDQEADFDRIFEQELNTYLNNQSHVFSRISMPEIKNTVIPPKPKLKKIPMTRTLYTKNAKGKLEAPVCCICLTNMKLNDQITQLKCKHMFHYQCIDKWIQTKEECPFCRGEISQ